MSLGLPLAHSKNKRRESVSREATEAIWKRQQGKARGEGRGCRNAPGSFEEGLGLLTDWWAERRRLKRMRTLWTNSSLLSGSVVPPWFSA